MLKKFPDQSSNPEDVLSQMRRIKDHDIPWESGKIFGFVYYPGVELARFIETIYSNFLHENALNPSLFPSLWRIENDTVGMIADLLHGDDQVVGNMTSGGTESIFLVLKAARDHFLQRKNGPGQPEIMLPKSVHPAFHKGAHYLNMKIKPIPLCDQKRAIPGYIKNAINKNTALIAASAPSYPHGVMDPIEDIASIAQQHDIPFHVDACLGGFMLPFLEDLQYPVPRFDFRIPGVTSISVDPHKFGFAPKGASVILYRNKDFRKHQIYVHTDWPGGLFATAGLLGTRSGASMAATWAIINRLGRKGYTECACQSMRATTKIKDVIQQINGLRIVGDPVMSILSFTSEYGNIYQIGDDLSKKGWHLDRLQYPEALHMTLTPHTARHIDTFIQDLRHIVRHKKYPPVKSYRHALQEKAMNLLLNILPETSFKLAARFAAQQMKAHHGNGQRAALYGFTSTHKKRHHIHTMLLELVDSMYTPSKQNGENSVSTEN